MMTRGKRSAWIAALAIVLSAVLPGYRLADQAATAAEAGPGRLTGTVIIGTRLSTRRVRFNLYSDPSAPPISRKAETPGETENVVVYLEPAGPLPAMFERPVARKTMRQEGQSFMPHTLPILRGSAVDFPNGDAIYHNVFSLSKATSFDLGRYP